jgi:hypothetical protein
MTWEWIVVYAAPTIGMLSAAGGLFFHAVSLRAHTAEIRLENLSKATAAHRELWLLALAKPEILHALQEDVSADTAPTTEEFIWVRELLLHTADIFRKRRKGMYHEDFDLAADIRQFLAKPIPRQVWTCIKEFQESDFVEFIEVTLHGKQ